jgi:predicted small secreted protein
MRKVFAVILLLVFMMTISACNTMRGIGQDIEKGGQAIKKAADK